MYGTLEQTPDSPRLRFVRLLPHPPAKVWRALTEPGPPEGALEDS